MSLRVLFISAAPIQNAEPFRILHQKPDLQIKVAYCSLPLKGNKKNEEYITQQAFDIDVLDEEYPWVQIANYSPKPGLWHFFGLINPGLLALIRQHDVVVIYGHAYFSLLFSILAAKLFRKKLILTSDATHIEPPDGKKWKIKLKKILFPILYNRIADHVFVPSNKAKKFMSSLGVDENRITRTGYTVDNEYIKNISDNTDVSFIRQKLGVPQDALVVVFCAKFIKRKRPQDAVKAFIKAQPDNAYLLMIGDGPMKTELENEVAKAGLRDKILFPGLVQYSNLHQYYTASDILVFCSETEQFGLPVNEAMICGLPVLLSDQIGAVYDLLEEGKTGYKYKCGDVEELSYYYQLILSDPEKLKKMGEHARKTIEAYSPAFNAANIEQAVKTLFGNRTSTVK